jgi:hypothetical protein
MSILDSKIIQEKYPSQLQIGVGIHRKSYNQLTIKIVGATTLSIITFVIMTLSIMVLFVTLDTSDTQHKRYSAWSRVPLCSVSRFYFYTGCCYAEHVIVINYDRLNLTSKFLK